MRPATTRAGPWPPPCGKPWTGRVDGLRQQWTDEIAKHLDEHRVVRALRLAARPPEPPARMDPELHPAAQRRGRRSHGAGHARGSLAGADRRGGRVTGPPLGEAGRVAGRPRPRSCAGSPTSSRGAFRPWPPCSASPSLRLRRLRRLAGARRGRGPGRQAGPGQTAGRLPASLLGSTPQANMKRRASPTPAWRPAAGAEPEPPPRPPRNPPRRPRPSPQPTWTTLRPAPSPSHRRARGHRRAASHRRTRAEPPPRRPTLSRHRIRVRRQLKVRKTPWSWRNSARPSTRGSPATSLERDPGRLGGVAAGHGGSSRRRW